MEIAVNGVLSMVHYINLTVTIHQKVKDASIWSTTSFGPVLIMVIMSTICYLLRSNNNWSYNTVSLHEIKCY